MYSRCEICDWRESVEVYTDDRLFAWSIAVSLSSTAVLPESSPPNDSHPTGSRLRKRGRDESISNNDAPVSSGPSLGDQTSRSKRAKIQARPAEPSRRTRRTVQSAAQNVPVSTIQYTAVGAGQLSFDTPMPSEVTANDSDHQGFGAMSMDDSTRISLQGLQLRNQSLPVLDNFVSQNYPLVDCSLTFQGNANTERVCHKLIP